MIADQRLTCHYQSETLDVEIQMTVRVSRPKELYASVQIAHDYEPILPDHLFDEWLELFGRMNNGVNGGYALSNVPYIPDTILSVHILELKVSPAPENIISEDKINLGYLLEVTVSGVVETLLRGMENLITGKEIYFAGDDPSPNDEDNASTIENP